MLRCLRHFFSWRVMHNVVTNSHMYVCSRYVEICRDTTGGAIFGILDITHEINNKSGILKNEEKRAAGLVGLRHLIVIGQNSGTEFVLFSLMNVPKS